MSVRSNICTFITAAVLSGNPPCYYRIQQHYLTNHTVGKLLYLTCKAKLILKIKKLIRMVSIVKIYRVPRCSSVLYIFQFR